MIAAASGDVLAVRNRGRGWFGHAVRFFEHLQHKPDIADHVVILTHQDVLGRWIGIEGKPSGVGLIDATSYLTDGRTRSNHDQPRLGDAQLATFLASCAKTLGIGYDWVGIAENAFDTMHLYDLSNDIEPIYAWSTEKNVMPGHFVCSSLAAWLYEKVGWAHPNTGSERLCEPADWWAFSDTMAWGEGLN
jgi:hypothetical protein